MAAILIAILDEQISQTFIYDIVGEVWGYADKVYCFLMLPTTKEGTERRNNAIDLFHRITDWSDITILQDNDDLPDNANFEDGMTQLLICCLNHPDIDDEKNHELMTTAEWSTVKQMWAILNSYVVNQMPAYLEAATFSFHKRGKEESWY